ncbi:GBS Bsp-like repeat-containing protein [Eubacteriaceae bacterium ES2]|nr:GBS Bsp-like repeat-containing protein [Eubacteriaceae bacterium ES2]
MFRKNLILLILLFLFSVSGTGSVVALDTSEAEDLSDRVLTESEIAFLVSEKGEGQFLIKTDGLSDEQNIGQVLFPVWTAHNGQDDLIWHQGIRQSDGEYAVTVSISDHHFEAGLYQIHCYISDQQGTLLSVLIAQFSKENEVFQFTSQQATNDQYTIGFSGISSTNGLQQVLVPTWSETGGQDDIRWEEAQYLGDNSWKVNIDLANYKKSYDCYYSHVYLKDSAGNFIFLGQTQETIENPFLDEPVSSAFSADKENLAFTVSTDNLSDKAGVKNVIFAVWTDRNGQDELKWLTGTKNGNEYLAQVSAADHNFETGRYTVHTYVFGRENEVISVGADSLVMEKAKPVIEYDNAVLDNTFKLRIKNVSSDAGVAAVFLPTWSQQGGQDDLHFEQAAYIGSNSWEAKIDLENYGQVVDTFISHGYVQNRDGGMDYQLAATRRISQDTRTIYGNFAYPLSKSYKPNTADPTDWFGPRWGDIHEGIDIPAPYYAKCYSVCNGVVEKAGYFMGYGRYIRIKTVDRYGESVSFFYGHLQEINVSVGQTVTQGQIIGSVGGSGYNSNKIYIDNAYGPHLHFGAIANADDTIVNPEIWINFHNPYNNQ